MPHPARPSDGVTTGDRRHWCQACHEVALRVVERTKDDPNHRRPQTFGCSGMTMHDLRHSDAQSVSAAGMPLSQLRHALGHGDEQSTARYAAQRAARQAAHIAGAAFGKH
jgi:Phage integrase family